MIHPTRMISLALLITLALMVGCSGGGGGGGSIPPSVNGNWEIDYTLSPDEDSTTEDCDGDGDTFSVTLKQEGNVIRVIDPESGDDLSTEFGSSINGNQVMLDFEYTASPTEYYRWTFEMTTDFNTMTGDGFYSETGCTMEATVQARRLP